jgi:dihydrofolate reductase
MPETKQVSSFAEQEGQHQGADKSTPLSVADKPVKCSAFVAISVDGFIAASDGGLDWLDKPEFAPDRIKGLSYAEFIADVDGVVMGRKTFEKVLSFDPWPYGAMPVLVLSSTDVHIPTHLLEKVQCRSGAPQEIVAHLRSIGMRHLYVDGGLTIQRFLDANLIDEITLTRIPVLLGHGIALFGPSQQHNTLRLIDVAVSDSGIVQERYRVER